MKIPITIVRLRAALAAAAEFVRDTTTLVQVLIVVYSLLDSSGPTTPTPATAPIEAEVPVWADVA